MESKNLLHPCSDCTHAIESRCQLRCFVQGPPLTCSLQPSGPTESRDLGMVRKTSHPEATLFPTISPLAIWMLIMRLQLAHRFCKRKEGCDLLQSACQNSRPALGCCALPAQLTSHPYLCGKSLVSQAIHLRVVDSMSGGVIWALSPPGIEILG